MIQESIRFVNYGFISQKSLVFFSLFSKLTASFSSTSQGPGSSGNEVANMSLSVLEITPRQEFWFFDLGFILID